MSPFKCNSCRSFYLASISRKHQLEPFRTSKIRRLLGKAVLQLGDHRNVSIKLDGELKTGERPRAVIEGTRGKPFANADGPAEQSFKVPQPKEAARRRRPTRQVDAMSPANRKPRSLS